MVVIRHHRADDNRFEKLTTNPLDCLDFAQKGRLPAVAFEPVAGLAYVAIDPAKFSGRGARSRLCAASVRTNMSAIRLWVCARLGQPWRELVIQGFGEIGDRLAVGLAVSF